MLHELLDAMWKDARKKRLGVRIVWCDIIGAHVITENAVAGGLHWDSIDGCEFPDYDGLFAVLWERYHNPITAGEFSLEDHVWRKFRPDERVNIKAVLR